MHHVKRHYAMRCGPEGTPACCAVCPDGQQLAQDGTTCINMGLVNVGKFLYNNTAVQDGLYKATVRSAEPHTPLSHPWSLRPGALLLPSAVMELA